MSEKDLSLLSQTLKMLFQQAMEDGTFSDVEAMIIERVEIDVKQYEEVLIKAETDNKINLREAMQLGELKNTILANAAEIAARDYILSEDEKNLLRKLADILVDYF